MPPSLSLSPVSPPRTTYLSSNLCRQSKERFLPFSNLRKGSFPYDCSPTIYFCFHFTEIENLSSGTVREISIVLNDIYSIAPSIIL
ncbi:hypothetical protein IC575_011959 [Cucumis melo]